VEEKTQNICFCLEFQVLTSGFEVLTSGVTR